MQIATAETFPGDRLLAHETGISVRAAESPLECVALGALRLLGDRDALEGAQLA